MAEPLVHRTSTAEQWRVAGRDQGDAAPDYTNWGTEREAMFRIFQIWMDQTNPPYDEVWMEKRTVTFSEPERVDV